MIDRKPTHQKASLNFILVIGGYQRRCFKELAKEYASSLKFARVDVRKKLNVCVVTAGMDETLTSLPSFYVYHKGARVDAMTNWTSRRLRLFVYRNALKSPCWSSSPSLAVQSLLAGRVSRIASLRDVSKFLNERTLIVKFMTKELASFRFCF